MEPDDRGGGRLVSASSSWTFGPASCASAACASDCSSSRSRSWRCCSNVPARSSAAKSCRRALWPADTFVDFDHGLNKAINKIREALGDSAESPALRRDRGPPRLPLHRRCARSPTRCRSAAPARDHTLAVTDSLPNRRRPPSADAVKIATSTPVSPAWAIAARLMLVLLGLAAWRFFRAGALGR